MDFLENIKFPKTLTIVVFLALLGANVLVWWEILGSTNKEGVYFLDVGQGDSQLVVLPGNVKILIDAGRRNGRVLEHLSEIFHPTDKYIDLLVMSHPHFDHFGGFIDILERYRVGAFITPGTRNDIKSFQLLESLLEEKEVPVVKLGRGDGIRHKEGSFDILWPVKESFGWGLDESSLVLELSKKGATFLFTGDIGFKAEEEVLTFYEKEVDVLKVAHHGSKYSTSLPFLEVIRPFVAVIGVGENSWGHPTEEVLGRLSAFGTEIYRTDLDGNVKILIDDGNLRVFKLR